MTGVQTCALPIFVLPTAVAARTTAAASATTRAVQAGGIRNQGEIIGNAFASAVPCRTKGFMVVLLDVSIHWDVWSTLAPADFVRLEPSAPRASFPILFGTETPPRVSPNPGCADL